MVTASGLLFAGSEQGDFTAYDAKTLQSLWSFNVGTGINAPAMTYSVNGKQYVAVLVGWLENKGTLAKSPELKNNATSSMLWVFSL